MGKDKGQIDNIGESKTKKHTPNERGDTNEPFDGMVTVMPNNAEEGMVVGHVLDPIILVPGVIGPVVGAHQKKRNDLDRRSLPGSSNHPPWTPPTDAPIDDCRHLVSWSIEP
jgi:hypothetical protein